MNQTTIIESNAIYLPQPNIDTDQIIPARYLTTTSQEGLGQYAFADWRYDEKGNEKTAFAFNRPESQSASILIAGSNFGCGSSREHAAWALYDWGIRAVISDSLADIFRANAMKNGIVPVVVDEEMHEFLLNLGDSKLKIDLNDCSITAGDRTAIFNIDEFGRYCLMNGVDELGYLLNQTDAISQYEESLTCKL